MPHRSSIALNWRLKRGRYCLIGTKCHHCGAVLFPAKSVCSCGHKTDDYRLSGSGKVVSFTAINTAPGGFEKEAPYNVGLIKLEEGPTITAQIKGDGLKIGSNVHLLFRKISEDETSGLIQYGLKFGVEETP
jgi:uncharacterized protein